MGRYSGAIVVIGFGMATLLFGIWQEMQFTRKHYANLPSGSLEITGSIKGRK